MQNQEEKELDHVTGICFINELHPELLSRIFALTIDSHLDTSNLTEETSWLAKARATEKAAHFPGSATGCDEAESPNHLSLTPIIPSSVCRYWRDIAISTPSLWTALVLWPLAGRSYEHISTLLERSTCLPIDIRITCYYDDEAELLSETELRSIFSMLIPHVHRWRTMRVSVLDYNLMDVFFSEVSDPSIPAAPQLTTLALYHDEEGLDEIETFWYPLTSMTHTPFGGSAPLLSKIVFHGVHVAWDQPWIASASNLTDLTLTDHMERFRPSWAQFESMLRGAPALEKLTLDSSGPSGEPPVWSTKLIPGAHEYPIQLIRLTDFDISYCSPACAIGLLRRLYLPSLKNLALEFLNHAGDYTDFVHELAGPATCLSPVRERPPSLLSRLDRLELGTLPCRDDCVETLYSELQNLTSLKLVMRFLPPSFLNVLSKPCTLTSRCDVWLPRLTTLYAAGVFYMADSLCEVVRKRREGGAPLSTLYLDLMMLSLDKVPRLEEKYMDDLRENVASIKVYQVGGFWTSVGGRDTS